MAYQRRSTPFLGVHLDIGHVPIFANLVRHANGSGSVGAPYDTTTGPPVDARCSPTGDFGLSMPFADNGQADTISLQFPGRADVTLPYTAATLVGKAWDSDTNTTTATIQVQPNQSFIQVGFANTRRLPTDTTPTGIDCSGLYIMRPVSPGGAPHPIAEEFTRQLRVILAPWKGGYYRDLDLGLVNNIQNPNLAPADHTLDPQTWANRTQPYDPIQYQIGQRGRGVALEIRIRLANWLGMGWWNIVPDTYTADYWDKLTDLVRFGSDADGNPYTSAQSGPANPPLADKYLFEYSNECWNDSFAQAYRMDAAAAAMGTALNDDNQTNPYILRYYYQGYKLLQLADVCKAKWGAAGLGTAYFPILSSQSNYADKLLAAADKIRRLAAARGEAAADNIAAGGGAFYVDFGIDAEGNNPPTANQPGVTVEQVVASGFKGSGGIALDGKLVLQYGIDFSAYEGGMCYGDNGYSAHTDALSLDPAMADPTFLMALNAILCGCRYLTPFSLIAGPWSLTDSIFNLTAAKLAAYYRLLTYFPADGSAGAALPAPTGPTIADGSFEQYPLDYSNLGHGTPYDYVEGPINDPSKTPWILSAAAEINGVYQGYGIGGAPLGAAVGVIHTGGTIRQVVPNWGAGTYRITYQASQRNTGQTPYKLGVYVDGALVDAYTPPNPAPYGSHYWPHTTAPFTVAAGSHEVKFAWGDASPPNVDTICYIDAVTLLPAGTPGPITLTGVAVSPAAATVAGGATRQLRLIATYSNGATADVTGAADANWPPSAPGGLYTAPAAGGASQAVQVAAAHQGYAATAAITVPAAGGGTAPTLTGVALAPPGATVAGGGSRSFTLAGTYSDGSTADLTADPGTTWPASAPGGHYTAPAATGSAQTATLTVTNGGFSATASITVPAVIPTNQASPYQLLESLGLCG